MPRLHRPVFLSIVQIQMPVGAVTSIRQRLAGILLAACVPLCVYILDVSLQGEQGFAAVTGLFSHFAFKAVAVFVLWAFAHHMLGGVRHLLTDIDVDSPLPAAHRSAWLVNLAGIAVALLAAGFWL